MIELDLLPESKFTRRVKELNGGTQKETLLGALADFLGLGGIGLGLGLGVTGAGIFNKERNEKAKLIEALRKRIGEAPPSAEGPEGLQEAMNVMQNRWHFRPDTGTYQEISGPGALGNTAYNRRLGALARSLSNNTPQGYAERMKKWQGKRTGDIDSMLKRFEELSIPAWRRPSFYTQVPKEFGKKIKDLFTGKIDYSQVENAKPKVL